MSNYLAQIATRNIAVPGPPVLSPAMPPAAKAAEDPFEQNTDAPPITSFPNDSFFSRDKGQQTPPESKDIKNNIENEVSHKGFETTYITRHIERFELGETKQPGNILSEKPVTDLVNKKNIENLIKEQPAGKRTPETKAFLKTVEKETGKEPKKKILPVQTLQPQKILDIKQKTTDGQSLENTFFKEKSKDRDSKPVPRLAPTPPRVEANSSQSRSDPRLVIGKITVEIVPPDKPVVQKVINRIIQAPAAADHSKINKLSFGLGQL